MAKLQYYHREPGEAQGKWITISGGASQGYQTELFETRIIYEVFTDFDFVNTAPGTFKCTRHYAIVNQGVSESHTEEYVGAIVSGNLRFNLSIGTYRAGHNMLEVIIDDTFHRSAKSGGITEEVDNIGRGNGFVLLNENDEFNQLMEVVAKYYTRVSLGGTGARIIVSGDKLDDNTELYRPGDIWVNPFDHGSVGSGQPSSGGGTVITGDFYTKDEVDQLLYNKNLFRITEDTQQMPANLKEFWVLVDDDDEE